MRAMKFNVDGCNRWRTPPMSRREMLKTSAIGFGALASASLLPDSWVSGSNASVVPARARHVILLHMDGGVSHVDTFDPKPRLQKENGKRLTGNIAATQFDAIGPLMQSPWRFSRYGQSGLPVSELFPHIGSCADELCVIRSMVCEFPEHSAANFFFHTGTALQGRPSTGAWISYGLGKENENLPAFMVISGGSLPVGGFDNIGSGFLPATHQASVVSLLGEPFANILPSDSPAESQIEKLNFVAERDSNLLKRLPAAHEVEAAIVNQELAFRMQNTVPDLLQIDNETRSIQKLYGLESPNKSTQLYGRQCLLARRMIERGVRFVELTMPTGCRWDQHANLKGGHERNAFAVDQPIAGLLKDLRSRGLLDETLVVWAGEFGRTPFAQGDGRDHNPYGYAIWLAGGGVRGGYIHGATDPYGYRAIENQVAVHDLHATILWLLGLDHTKLTYAFGGRDFRLTDVYGNVVHELVA